MPRRRGPDADYPGGAGERLVIASHILTGMGIHAALPLHQLRAEMIERCLLPDLPADLMYFGRWVELSGRTPVLIMAGPEGVKVPYVLRSDILKVLRECHGVVA